MVDVSGVVVKVLHPIQQPMNAFVKEDTVKLVLINLDEEFVNWDLPQLENSYSHSSKQLNIFF
jgi:hypothetical protein